MSIRTLATLAVAVVLALIAAVIINSYLTGVSKKAQVQQVAGGGLTPVVVAAQPIVRGATLAQPLLKVVSYPQASVPAGAYKSIQDLTGPAAKNRLALHSMVVNEPILPNDLTNSLNLSSVLDPGMQAIAIKDNDVAGVGGFILPGDRVDVMLTRSVSGGGGGRTVTVTQIVAENVQVMGVDQSDNDEATKPTVARTVTVEVTPVQAQTIALGGKIAGWPALAFPPSCRRRHAVDQARHDGGGAGIRPAAGKAGVDRRPQRRSALWPQHRPGRTRSTDTTGWPARAMIAAGGDRTDCFHSRRGSA